MDLIGRLIMYHTLRRFQTFNYTLSVQCTHYYDNDVLRVYCLWLIWKSKLHVLI